MRSTAQEHRESSRARAPSSEPKQYPVADTSRRPCSPKRSSQPRTPNQRSATFAQAIPSSRPAIAKPAFRSGKATAVIPTPRPSGCTASKHQAGSGLPATTPLASSHLVRRAPRKVHKSSPRQQFATLCNHDTKIVTAADTAETNPETAGIQSGTEIPISRAPRQEMPTTATQPKK